MMTTSVLRGQSLADGRRIAEYDDLAPGTYELLVTLLDADGTVVSRRVIVEVRASIGVTVLIARDCVGKVCPDSGDDPSFTQCFGGRCVLPTCSPEHLESCGTPECASDTECTGAVACSAPRCVAGACLDVPDDGACGAGERCSLARGCVAVMTPMDGGPTDAGVPDAGALVPVTLPRSLSGGYWHTCAVRGAGSVRCWGDGSSGRLGNGATDDSPNPVTVAGLTDAVRVSVYSQSCALRSTGGVVCWGSNTHGGLGDGTMVDSLTPVAVMGLSDAVDLAAGAEENCAIRATGQIVCWGQDPFDRTDCPVPVTLPGVGNAVDVALGQTLGCASTSDGHVVCWGNNDSGQLGDGTRTGRSEPAPVVGIDDAVSVGVGYYVACALHATGAVDCWGDSGASFLGPDITTYSATPVPVAGIDDAVQLSVGYLFGCVLRRSGNVSCWGDNYNGELGDGTDMNARPTPITIAGLTDLVEIEAGAYHTCGLHASGDVSCWGDNGNGQLGDGTNVAHSSPAPVLGL